MSIKFYRKKWFICLASFLTAALGMALIYSTYGIYPGSRRTLFAFDMRAQFSALFAALRYLGDGDSSFFFNSSLMLGENGFGQNAYYMLSPLSWLVNLFDLEHLSDGIWLLTILKIGLCGLTFAYFLETGFRTQKGNLYTILFATCYALMSYNMAYSVSPMWLDGVLMLPLILTGIERMLHGKRGCFYLASLAALFYFNFYISYMVGIFAVLYLAFRLFCIWKQENRKFCLQIILRFCLNSLLAIGLAAPVLLSSFMSLINGKIAAGQEISEEIFYFPIWELFTKLLPAQFDSILSAEDGLPSVYCGTVTIMLVVYYFLRRAGKRRARIGAAGGLVFLAVSFCVVKLDRIWHGFQYPTGFPWRYAFLFSTILLLIAVRGFEALPLSRKLWRTVVRVCCLYTFVELYLNGYVVIGEVDYHTYYTMQYEYMDTVTDTEALVADAKELDNDLYRMEKDYSFSDDDGMLFGYNGITCFSSFFHTQVTDFVNKMGFVAGHNYMNQKGSTFLTDSLLSVKYRMMRYGVTDEWTELEQVEYTKLYRNDYALPIAFWTNAAAETDLSESDDPFENQNAWLQALTGTEHSYYQGAPCDITRENGRITITYTVLEDGPVYMRALGEKLPGWDEDEETSDEDDTSFEKKLSSELLVDGVSKGTYYFSENYGNVLLGDLKAGERVTAELLYDTEKISPTDIYLVREDTETLITDLEMLAQYGLDVTSHGNGNLEGTVTAPEDGWLFTSIPYDDGFTILVDGEKTDYSSFDDTFLMIPVTEGTHQIEISYISPGFYAGLWLCGASVIILIGGAVRRRFL